MSELTIKAIAPWFGANRMLAPAVGEELRGCEWVGIPFAGSMAEVPEIKARAIVVNDVHRHVINLALCIQCETRRQLLVDRLANAAFHPDALEKARLGCRAIEGDRSYGMRQVTGSVEWAYSYFIACWMNRSALAGTDGEFKGGLPIRWSASGGDSNTRYRSAVASLDAWGATMRRCNFSTLDWRQFVAKCKDAPRHGVYCDPPFPGPGEKYKYTMTDHDHRDLASVLADFTSARVVCRFYDCPLVRELYPEGRWTWRRLAGRDQANNDAKPELLIINGASLA